MLPKTRFSPIPLVLPHKFHSDATPSGWVDVVGNQSGNAAPKIENFAFEELWRETGPEVNRRAAYALIAKPQ